MISRISKSARISWSVAYLFFTLSGIVACFAPAQIIAGTLISVLTYVWAIFLILGGGSSLGGKIANNWVGEIIGLPLLSAASFVFGILLLMRGTSAAAIAIGGVFCGVGTAYIGRWIELRKLARDNQEVNSDL